MPLIHRYFPPLWVRRQARICESARGLGDGRMETGPDLIRRWRDMAEECRVRAEQMADAGARSSFLHIARTYDDMADRFASEAAKRSALEAAASWLTGATPGGAGPSVPGPSEPGAPGNTGHRRG